MTRRALEVLGVATRLGVTSFGGPVAHLGYFREEYVARRRWLTDATYADLVALCQFLPGPASSQVGIGVGLLRAGYPGSVLAWLGFTLPSAVLLVMFAWVVQDVSSTSWLEGLKVVAVAVVAWAVWGMARMLTPDRARLLLAIAAAIFVLSWATPAAQVVAIVVGGVIGWRFLTAETPTDDEHGFSGSKRVAIASLAVFALLLALLPVLARATTSGTIDVIDSFYRAGSLVFGGGHVVLPLLESEVVAQGWVSSGDFVAGYGATQAVPGPLFTFAAYLGFVMDAGPGGVGGRSARHCGDLPPLVPARLRRASLLGRPPPAAGRAVGARGRQRGRRRAPARGALRPRVDERDPRPGRLRARARRLRTARRAPAPALARGRRHRPRRRRAVGGIAGRPQAGPISAEEGPKGPVTR